MITLMPNLNEETLEKLGVLIKETLDFLDSNGQTEQHILRHFFHEHLPNQEIDGFINLLFHSELIQLNDTNYSQEFGYFIVHPRLL
jgi:hypothetical protein